MTAKSDVLVKLVLVFFISLLSFSIGTFVGKKYSDNQHRLAALEPLGKEADREVASEGGAKTEGTAAAMSDQDISKLAEEFADDSTTATIAKDVHEGAAAEGEKGEHAEHKAEAKEEGKGEHEAVAEHSEHEAPVAKAEHGEHKAVAAHSVKANAEAETSPAAKNLVAGKAPVEEKAPKKVSGEGRIPSSLPKDVAQYSVGKFTLQIAAFPSEPEAKKRAEALKSKGYSAFYIPATVKGKTWYRVSVGLFATEKEAKEYRTEFSSKSKVENTIIQKIVN